MVHVLNTITSASSGDGASPSPSSSSMPLMRSESWAFIWQPNVVTWYRRIDVIVGTGRGDPGAGPAHARGGEKARRAPPQGLEEARVPVYFANSTARLSLMTVTLIWPG